MGLRANKKLVIMAIGLVALLAFVLIAVKHSESKKGAQNAALQTQPVGICAPNPVCKSNPKLCMVDNLNKVCG